jgi:transketolase N-terminal domain/subunit
VKNKISGKNVRKTILKMLYNSGASHLGSGMSAVEMLISMYASVGKSAIADVPLATNQAIAWSIPNQQKILTCQ